MALSWISSKCTQPLLFHQYISFSFFSFLFFLIYLFLLLTYNVLSLSGVQICDSSVLHNTQRPHNTHSLVPLNWSRVFGIYSVDNNCTLGCTKGIKVRVFFFFFFSSPIFFLSPPFPSFPSFLSFSFHCRGFQGMLSSCHLPLLRREVADVTSLEARTPVSYHLFYFTQRHIHVSLELVFLSRYLLSLVICLWLVSLRLSQAPWRKGLYFLLLSLRTLRAQCFSPPLRRSPGRLLAGATQIVRSSLAPKDLIGCILPTSVR